MTRTHIYWAPALARFDGYADLYSSCVHILWIQFPEDLLATLGIPRAQMPEGLEENGLPVTLRHHEGVFGGVDRAGSWKSKNMR